ncbi:MAG: hypothetical protein U0840_28215 [Gemmataceae bacterium]
MRFRGSILLALAGLLVLGLAPAQAQDATKPSLLLRLKPLEELIGDLRFLVKEVGREEEAKQIESMLKARTSPQGLEGVDVKKPIGLFAVLKPSLNSSEVALLLPIADEKTFLAFLEQLNFKPEKDKDGLYTLQVENVPVPLLFRFANGYLYGMAKLNEKMTLPAKDKLPNPEKILAEGSGLLSLTANVDQLPPQLRKLAISASAFTLGELKDQDLPAATPKQKAVWAALLDESATLVKSVLEDATAVQLKLDVDRKARDLTLGLTLASKPDSTLAKNFASLNPSSSVASGIGTRDSVMGGMVYLALPAAIKKAAVPAIEEAIAKATENLDPGARELLTPLIDSLKPSATAGKFDLGLDMRGPGKKGKYTLVLSAQLEKGLAIEKALKELVSKMPEDQTQALKTDFAKEGDVNIHRVTQLKMDAQAKEMFGTGALYFAARDDALIVTLGEDALPALKAAVKARPSIGTPLQLAISGSRLAKFMAKDQKHAPEAARKAFTDPGSDQMRLTLSAGERLELKLSIRTAVLAFASYLDRLNKGE